MFYPQLDEARTISAMYSIVPVMAEYYADTETPISIFKKIRGQYTFLLESVEVGEDKARYSFLGRNPFLTFKSEGTTVWLTDYTGKTEKKNGNPLKILEAVSKQYQSPVYPHYKGFGGGAVGYFGYDVARTVEHLPHVPKDDLRIPDMHFMFVDEMVAFDHLKQKLIIIVNIHSGSDFETRYDRATRRIAEIKNELDRYVPPSPDEAIRFRDKVEVKSNMTKEEYCDKVNKAKDYIVQGDIFQVVLAQRFCVETDIDPFHAYRALRVINPSPYMFYLDFGDYQIAGASPELLVKVDGGRVKTCPIAGTRKRGGSPEEDKKLEAELLKDEKETAEHVMLVDLGRNDIGKVSEFGSVTVERFKYVQYFSHVMHIKSDVIGQLKKECTAFDALAAALPAGTLSGAPKIRAMEIIDELENNKRCFYGGAIGYIDFSGNFDSCITIRTALFKNNKAYIGAGGGIVYDSDPEAEYQESQNKAAAVIRAIEEAGEIV